MLKGFDIRNGVFDVTRQSHFERETARSILLDSIRAEAQLSHQSSDAAELERVRGKITAYLIDFPQFETLVAQQRARHGLTLPLS